MTKSNCWCSLNRFAEFALIYRKYLKGQIFYKFLLIFILLKQKISPRTRDVFMGGAPTYVCHIFLPSMCLSIRPLARHVISGTVYFSYYHILLDWQIGIFLKIGWKSANQNDDRIWQVSYSFAQKIVFNGCHTDVFLKTACVQTCSIKLIEGIVNAVNHRKSID